MPIQKPQIIMVLMAVVAFGVMGCSSPAQPDSSKASPVQASANSTTTATNNTSGNNTIAATTPTNQNTPGNSTVVAASPLDATDRNPGTSINPIDKGKSIETDQLRFTLLDVRQDTNGDTYGNKKVYLVKLQVERFKNDSKKTADTQTGLSVADVELATKPDYNRLKDTGKGFDTEFFYDRAKLGITLSRDVKNLLLGQKVVGYYTFDGTTAADSGNMYFIVHYVSADSVTAGKMGGIAGTLKVK